MCWDDSILYIIIALLMFAVAIVAIPLMVWKDRFNETARESQAKMGGEEKSLSIWRNSNE